MAGKRDFPFVIVYGEEGFFLDRAILEAKASKSREVIFLDGDGLSDFEVVSACEQPGDDPVLVIVDNANKVKGDKALSAYISDKAADDTQVVLLAVVRSEKLSNLWQSAASKGRHELHKKAKPWELGVQLDRITAEADRVGVQLEADVPTACLAFFGDNLAKTSNELRKLALVVRGRRATRVDLISIAAPDLPADPFDVAKMATNKEVKNALQLLALLFKTGGDAVAIPITAGLMSQIERLLITRQMVDRGDDTKVIADTLGIPAFPVQKDVIPRAKKFTVKELLGQMQNLCKLDAQVKGAARSKRTLVELAVLSIAA